MTQSAFIFPGQGSQSVGMLSELAAAAPEIQQSFDRASEVLDRDCWALTMQGPDEDLNRTEWTQPMMLVADIAVWRVYCRLQAPRPAYLAGHSLGEYAALVAAEAMSFDDALRIVRLRGQLMQQAVPEGAGAMAAILGLEDQQVEQICRSITDSDMTSNQVMPANYNSPGQIVIAGHRTAVDIAIETCKEQGARRAMRLPVSVPSHSALMAPAAEPLREALEQIDFFSPTIPVLHNCDVQARAEPDQIRSALVQQLTQPVRWTETIQTLSARGVQQFMECGPARILTGLGKRINRDAEWFALDNPQTLNQLSSRPSGDQS